jgi:uncharacterized membrane protein YphA (DoxX/SURF4 family)
MRRSEWREKDDRNPVQPTKPATVSRIWPSNQIYKRTSTLSCRWFDPVARIAIFVIYFWFGFLKLLNLSPATPLASALVSHTIGMQYFNVSFKALAVFECVLGLIFLIPAMTWPSTVLLVVHLVIVSSPLVLVGEVAWIHPLVPTLEGQYIIKDLAILALAIGIIACKELSSREAPPAMANRPGRVQS